MSRTTNGKGLIFRMVCLFAVTFVLTVIAALAPQGLMAARNCFAGYGGGDGGVATPGKWEWSDSQKEWVFSESLPYGGMPDTGISGTLQIVLAITLGISVIFLCIILRAIIKEIRSYDEEE